MNSLMVTLLLVADSARLAFQQPIFKAAVAIAGFWLLYVIVHRYMGAVIRPLVRRHSFGTPAEEKQREETLVGITRTASAVLAWIMGVIAVLVVLGVNLSAFLTSAGLIGIIVGFGAQNIIKDFLSGFFIILENQYRVGDIVTLRGANEVSGVVESLTIRVTKLRDLDGNQHTVQNGDIDVVTNMSFGFANVNVDVGVAYDSDIGKVEKIINQVGDQLMRDKAWQDRIIEPIVFLRVDEFGESAMLIKAVGKVMPGTQWDVAGEFRRRLKEAFDKAGVEIPLPQRVVHMADKPRARH